MKAKGEAALIILGTIAVIIVSIISFILNLISEIASVIVYYKKPIGITVLTCVGVLLAYQIFIILYFKSNRFKRIKDSISGHTKNCNDLNHYIQELKCSYVIIKSYDFGRSRMIDSSNYNFKRKEWSKDIESNQIHHCSATVCKNASNQPIKYFCKYFDIKKNEESLSNFERVLNDFTSVEQGKRLLEKEKDLILSSITKSIPALVFFLVKKSLLIN